MQRYKTTLKLVIYKCRCNMNTRRTVYSVPTHTQTHYVILTLYSVLTLYNRHTLSRIYTLLGVHMVQSVPNICSCTVYSICTLYSVHSAPGFAWVCSTKYLGDSITIKYRCWLLAKTIRPLYKHLNYI